MADPNLSEMRSYWSKRPADLFLSALAQKLRDIGSHLMVENINAGLEIDEDTVREMQEKGYLPILKQDQCYEVETDPSWGDPNTLYIQASYLTLRVQPGHERDAELYLRRNFNPDKVETEGQDVTAWWD